MPTRVTTLTRLLETSYDYLELGGALMNERGVLIVYFANWCLFWTSYISVNLISQNNRSKNIAKHFKRRDEAKAGANVTWYLPLILKGL